MQSRELKKSVHAVVEAVAGGEARKSTTRRPPRRQRLPIAFALLIAVYCTIGVILLLWPKGQPVPLVDQHDWRIEGQMFDTPRPTDLDLPKGVGAAPPLRLWRSWSPETLHTKGRVSSAPFAAQRYLAIPYYGFPGEIPGNTIELRCITSDRTFPVANMRTNVQWSTAYLRLPRDFCSSQLQLVANASGTRHILGRL